ncbi:hypothetical protein DQE82_10905 [Micromonospora sp. LHW51205]|nr:hypothetical protein DQE82_10905 [Micromonospora sp. LHW51205]
MLEGHSDRVNDCVASRDSQSIISIGEDGKLIQWDVESGRAAHAVPHLGGTGTCCDLASSGETLYVGGADGSVHLYTAQGLGHRGAWKGHDGPVTSCASSFDGEWLASTGRDKTLRIWNTKEGRLVASMRVDGALLSCRWIADSHELCATGDGGVYLFAFVPIRRALETRERLSE